MRWMRRSTSTERIVDVFFAHPLLAWKHVESETMHGLIVYFPMKNELQRHYARAHRVCHAALESSFQKHKDFKTPEIFMKQ